MEVISPWVIYWVLQLDAIGLAAGLASFLGAGVVIGAWLLSDEIGELWALLVATILSLLWALIVLVAVFLPSTKTAAAMFVIPKIANNETIQREAGELYDLAKQAIREAAGSVKKPEPKEEE